ncbi:TIGR02678 family protein [Fusibacter sp. 3D3]|uniref:TIGR02678 family protein n=1 Tax=Fusibacter sp. 3D3 TaxID=1048380 RepID=UPI0008538EB6|nr:TIGR02678 family protein [Fusibacter sp. 3D3]GAU77734.1 hypothetical protein F3D3_2363 [Fusibacter sp. 3D3]
MEEIRELLNQRWVLKKNNPDLYFKIKDHLKEFQEFFKDKLGYAIMINPLMVKVEKLSGKSQSWMGIESFDMPKAYVFLCYVLMFLEDKEPEEQFVLSQLTDYIKSQPTESGLIDWTVYRDRRSLIKVLDFCKEESIILMSDGDDSGFAGSESSVEVLYENTGASKYFMRRFPFDITPMTSLKELEALDWQSDDGERGIVRRYRVYRRLVLEPIVYQQGAEDQDYLYIKNMRSTLTYDFERYLGVDFHLHKNGAMLIFPDSNGIIDALPNRRNLSDVVLQVCFEIREAVREERFERLSTDKIHLSQVKWDMFIQEVRTKYHAGWTKKYRELAPKALREEIDAFMSGFGMIEIQKMHKEVWILPAAAKMVGSYPADYWLKKEDIDGRLED